MVDLDEGKELLHLSFTPNSDVRVQGGFMHSQWVWLAWVMDNAPALIAELRDARATIAAQKEQIAALNGELQCLKANQ